VNAHVISLGSFLNLLETLVDVTVEDGIPQTRSDFFIFTVLSCLPWIGRELQDKKEQDFETLLASIEEYISKRNKNHIISLKVWHTETPHPQEEYLDCLWAQISKLKSDKWVEHHIIRVYHAFGGTLQDALQHNLPQFMPPPHDTSFVYPYPKVVFRLFDYTDCPEGAAVLPGAHAIERFLSEESILNTINLMYFNRKDCASVLSHLPSIQRYPFEYMMVEVILGEMLRLPKSPQLEIFYGSLLLELCKLHAGTLPLVLAQAVVLIFERLDHMNGACIDIFSSWFAYHLSNFQFRWTWEDWAASVNLDPLHPKTVFLRETFVRCMRLSYHGRVADLVPAAFKHLLPAAPDPIAKFTGEGSGDVSSKLLEIAELLKEEFTRPRKKDEEKDVISLESLPDLDNLPPIEGFDGESAKINLVVNVLLNTSSQSFTHLFTAIGRWSSVLAELMTTDATQVALLQTLFEVWKNHQQLLVITIQKLIKYGIVDCTSVIEWIFSPGMRSELMRTYIWEIIFATIKRKEAVVREHEDSITQEKDRLKKFQIEGYASDKAEDIPSEDGIEKMEEQLEVFHTDVKNLLQLILTRFISVISRHIQEYESQGKSFKNYWFRWAIFRLQQLLFVVSMRYIYF
jgi:nuclear cap-binding protein subunit 1